MEFVIQTLEIVFLLIAIYAAVLFTVLLRRKLKPLPENAADKKVIHCKVVELPKFHITRQGNGEELGWFDTR